MYITCKIYLRKPHEKIYYNIETNMFHVYINQIPLKGKANSAIIKLLSKVTGISQYKILIIRGNTTTIKTIQLITTKTYEDICNLLTPKK